MEQRPLPVVANCLNNSKFIGKKNGAIAPFFHLPCLEIVLNSQPDVSSYKIVRNVPRRIKRVVDLRWMLIE